MLLLFGIFQLKATIIPFKIYIPILIYCLKVPVLDCILSFQSTPLASISDFSSKSIAYKNVINIP